MCLSACPALSSWPVTWIQSSLGFFPYLEMYVSYKSHFCHTKKEKPWQKYPTVSGCRLWGTHDVPLCGGLEMPTLRWKYITSEWGLHSRVKFAPSAFCQGLRIRFGSEIGDANITSLHVRGPFLSLDAAHKKGYLTFLVQCSHLSSRGRTSVTN